MINPDNHFLTKTTFYNALLISKISSSLYVSWQAEIFNPTCMALPTQKLLASKHATPDIFFQIGPSVQKLFIILCYTDEWTHKLHTWREPWSSSYGWRFMFERSWVWIPAPNTGWIHFFTLICKNCIDVCLKRPKINVNEAGIGPF